MEEAVAEGGFAVVYRALHTGFRAPVALKCLKIPEALDHEAQAEFLDRFRAEGELLFRLSTRLPTVVRPLHFGTLEPHAQFVPFIALEWLEGDSLDAILRQRLADGLKPFSLKRAVRLLEPIALALRDAHHFPTPEGEHSILHRDLKPENVLLASINGELVPKIVDFGIGAVKSTASQVVGRRSAGNAAMTPFTPAYGAPEQWLPKRFGQTGTWTDVWGLALTLVEMVVGRPVIDGDAGAMMGTVIDPTRRPTPRAEGLDTTDAVDAVFQRALAVDPRQRYQEVAVFFTDLQQALGLPTGELGAFPEVVRARPAVATPALEPAELPASSTAPPRAARDALELGPSSTVTLQSTSTTPGALYGGVVLDDDSATLSIALEPSGAAPAPSSAGTPLSSARGASGGHPRLPLASPPSLRPGHAPRGPSPAATSALVSARRAPSSSGSTERLLRERFGRPLALVVVGSLVAAADFLWTGSRGKVLMLGPVRVYFLAALLVVVGIGLGAYRLLADADS